MKLNRNLNLFSIVTVFRHVDQGRMCFNENWSSWKECYHNENEGKTQSSKCMLVIHVYVYVFVHTYIWCGTCHIHILMCVCIPMHITTCVCIYIYNMYKHMGFTKMKSCQTYPTSFFSKRIEISQKKGKRMELVHLRFSKMWYVLSGHFSCGRSIQEEIKNPLLP